MWSLQPIEMIFTRYWWEDNPGQKFNKIIRRSLHTATELTKNWEICLRYCCILDKLFLGMEIASVVTTDNLNQNILQLDSEPVTSASPSDLSTGAESEPEASVVTPTNSPDVVLSPAEDGVSIHLFRLAFIVWMQIPFHWENAAQTITAIFAVFIDTGRQ